MGVRGRSLRRRFGFDRGFAHFDHAGSAGKLKELSGCQIMVHRSEADKLKAGFTPIPAGTRWKAKMLVGVGRTFAGKIGKFPPADADLTPEDSFDLHEYGFPGKVIHTPGHTPGGICLYAKPNLFTGDTVFVGGVGRTDFPGGSSEQLLSSINSRLLSLPADTVVWPGHGYGGAGSTIGDEKRDNPFLRGGR